MQAPGSDTISKFELQKLTAKSFSAEYVERSRPVQLTRTIGEWLSYRWTREYLENRIGHRRVNLFYNENSTFDFNICSSTGTVKRRILPFTAALALIHSDQGGNYYIQQQDMRTEFPELLSDIERPALLADGIVIKQTNVWIGGKGCRTPLHFDHNHNFLVQVDGKKHVTLFPPSQSPNLYPAAGDVLEHCSRVNVFAPDLKNYPLFQEAERHKSQLLLQPGDTLFIPSGWWHSVESLEPSISVNFWWH